MIFGSRSLYGQGARFDHSRALTEEEMFRVAPSIFATEAHESRSERFRAIPTIEVLRGLSNEGFSVVAVNQSRTRDETKREFTKHMIRLRRLDDAKQYRVGDTVHEIILKNANDGTSAYDLMSGLFRIACLNSLVSLSDTLASVKVRHSGDAINNVIDGTYTVLKDSERVLEAPVEWSQLRLTQDDKMAFARAAHAVRFGDDDSIAAQAIKPEELLAPRRREDANHNDLWMTFNIAQENVIRGGLSAIGRDANNRQRRVSTREVKGIDQDIKLNKALWILAEHFAQHKKAA